MKWILFTLLLFLGGCYAPAYAHEGGVGLTLCGGGLGLKAPVETIEETAALPNPFSLAVQTPVKSESRLVRR